MGRPRVPGPGEVIDGKYSVIGEIATGGMGVVLRATHLHLREKVAIKVLRPEISLRPSSVARFMREARMTMKLRGEHVVRVFDVDVMDGQLPYIVMEHLEGEDLAMHLARVGRVPAPTALDWLRQTCEGVAEAHSLGIIHRDLKPANLFLTKRADGTTCLKVLDFGVSKASSLLDDFSETAPGSDPKIEAAAERSEDEDVDLTSTRTMLGSPRYMSPEQVRSPRHVDVRTDIWAIGAIGYEMLSGNPPFAGDDLDALRRDITDRDPLPLASPPTLRAVIERCLAKDPEQRYPNVSALARALEGGSTPRLRAWLLGAAAIGVVVIAVTRWPHPVGAPPPTPSETPPVEKARVSDPHVATPPPATSPAPSIATVAMSIAPKPSAPLPRPAASASASKPDAGGLSDHVFDNPE